MTHRLQCMKLQKVRCWHGAAEEKSSSSKYGCHASDCPDLTPWLKQLFMLGWIIVDKKRTKHTSSMFDPKNYKVLADR